LAQNQAKGHARTRAFLRRLNCYQIPFCSAKSPEMSDTRHRPCLDREKGAAFKGDRPMIAVDTTQRQETGKMLAEAEAKQKQHARLSKTK
jgi:hypothetical protein